MEMNIEKEYRAKVIRFARVGSEKGKAAVKAISDQLKEGQRVRIIKDWPHALQFKIVTGDNGSLPSDFVPKGARPEGAHLIYEYDGLGNQSAPTIENKAEAPKSVKKTPFKKKAKK